MLNLTCGCETDFTAELQRSGHIKLTVSTSLASVFLWEKKPTRFIRIKTFSLTPKLLEARKKEQERASSDPL